MIKILGRTTSFNVQKVLWLVDELSLDYEHIELGGRFGGLDTGEFGELNPLRKVPVLVDDGKSVWESHTILRYLAATYGDEHWFPGDSYQRTRYEKWLDWSQTTFQPAFMAVFWGYYRMPHDKRDMKTVAGNVKKCMTCLDALDQALTDSRFLLGEDITLADIPTGAVIYRLIEMGLEVTLPQFVTRWYESLQQRKGYQKWVMSDFSELKGRIEF